MKLGFIVAHFMLDHTIFYYKKQCRFHMANVRKVSKHHEGHEHQLILVGVLVVARFPVAYPCGQVLVVQNQDVSDAPHPGVFGC